MKKIALVLLPLFWPNLPPLSLAYLCGFLKAHGLKVDCLDLNLFFYNRVSQDLKIEWHKSCHQELEQNIGRILQTDYSKEFKAGFEQLLAYEIIGFSCYRSNFPTVRQISQLLKEKKPELRIILGGPEITSSYFLLGEQMMGKLSDLSDFLVVGEGELPLLRYLNQDFLREETHHRTSQPALAVFEEQKDLKNSPEPDFDQFELKEYPRKFTLPLMLSRGCIKKCSFCAERLLYQKFRLGSIEAIVQLISRMKAQGIQNVIFHDSLINGQLSWLEKLCDSLIDNFSSVPWEAQMVIRSDMPDTLFRKIKQSGCYHLFVGLESGCDRTLQRMEKGYSAKEALAFFQQLRKAELSFGISLLIGFPEESLEDFEESLRFIIEHKAWIPKIEQINPFVYYQGIPFSPSFDYRINPEALQRAQVFIAEIKKEGIKHTKAFLLNLVEPDWK